jgi:hypothetical protein
MMQRSRHFFLHLSAFLEKKRCALRGLSGPLAVALLSLGLAIAATAAIFGLMNEVSLKTLPVGDPANLVRFEDILDRGISDPGPHMTCLSEFTSSTGEGRATNPGFDSPQLGQTNSDGTPASDDAAPSIDNPGSPFHKLHCRRHNVLLAENQP